ncbi:MAG: RES family NAD+ phosphorylase [Gammaproteobacteria bacterium]|nr:MAG: RES family NAD+ phosphorylase [Gammaproteobacteria bacterium]
MIVWRLSHKDFTNLDGVGAKLKGGRWNTPGLPVVYTSSHLSLAVLELMVHLEIDAEDIPDNHVSIEIDVSESFHIQKMRKKIDFHDIQATRDYGDKWLHLCKNPGLEVKSVVIPQEANILINPLRADISLVKTKDIRPFSFDPRLFGTQL